MTQLSLQKVGRPVLSVATGYALSVLCMLSYSPFLVSVWVKLLCVWRHLVEKCW